MADSRELAEKAFSLLQDALKDSETRAAELDAELRKQRMPKDKVEEQVRVLEHRLESAEAEREKWKLEAAQLEEILENERAKVQGLRKKLTIAESGPEKFDKKEVNFWRSRVEQFDDEVRQYKDRINELRKSLKELSQTEQTVNVEEIDRLEAAVKDAEAGREHATTQVKERDAQLTELNARLASQTAEIAERESRLSAADFDNTELKARLESYAAERQELMTQLSELDGLVEDLKLENNQLISDLAEKRSELTTVADEREAHASVLAEKDRAMAERDQRIGELAEVVRQADEEQQATRDRIASLEEELREERECTVNLSEIANERREQITELSEKLDEAQERYEEAKWHLERAARFERLVIKRRKLIDSLIAALRAKLKANVALKAGLDGLRRYKAKSEQQEQKLLVRIEELSGRLRDADEQLTSQHQSSQAEEKLHKAVEKISSLEGRLAEQAKLLEKLQGDLSTARSGRESAERQASELTELTATREKDQSLIEALQLQVDSLQSELMRAQETASDGSTEAPDASRAEIRKRESQIADLKRRIKAQEKEIAKLEETVAGWQKKYEFLSTDAPSAYQSASGDK